MKKMKKTIVFCQQRLYSSKKTSMLSKNEKKCHSILCCSKFEKKLTV